VKREREREREMLVYLLLRYHFFVFLIQRNVSSVSSRSITAMDPTLLFRERERHTDRERERERVRTSLHNHGPYHRMRNHIGGIKSPS